MKPIKAPDQYAFELIDQIQDRKPGKNHMSPEREQAIVDHLLMHRNKNETMRELHVGLTTIYKICKKRGLRI